MSVCSAVTLGDREMACTGVLIPNESLQEESLHTRAQQQVRKSVSQQLDKQHGV